MSQNKHRKPKVPKSIKILLGLSASFVTLCIAAWLIAPTNAPFSSATAAPKTHQSAPQTPSEPTQKGSGTESARVTPTTEPSASTPSGDFTELGNSTPSLVKCKTA